MEMYVSVRVDILKKESYKKSAQNATILVNSAMEYPQKIA